MKKIRLFFAVYSVLFSVSQTSAQNFYEHYTGLISDELKLTADLIKSEDEFYGFYYYEYQEDGFWISSNPIALDGHISEDGSFVLNEFGGHSSYFKGQLENPKLIEGYWVNEMLQEDVKFTLKATYPKGSIPLNLIFETQKTYYNNDPSMPSSELELSLLFPNQAMDKGVYYQLFNKIYKNMGYRGESQKNEDVIAEIKRTYNQQFQSALQNIQLDSFSNSFKWQKNISVQVVNNQKSLLCLQFDTYAKSGSGEGTLVKKYLVFDLENNKLLSLKDIVNENKINILSGIVERKLREQYKLNESQVLSQFGFFSDSIQVSNNYFIHPGGIGFYYNVYEIAPFSNGATSIFIPWKALTDQDILLINTLQIFNSRK